MQSLKQIHELIKTSPRGEISTFRQWSELRGKAYQAAVQEHGLEKVALEVFHGESDAVIISKPPPVYPKEAADQKLEGYCVVKYTITKHGTTDKVKIADCPAKVFREASIEAAKKFLYKPKFENGKAVKDKNIRNRFRYKLSSDSA